MLIQTIPKRKAKTIWFYFMADSAGSRTRAISFSTYNCKNSINADRIVRHIYGYWGNDIYNDSSRIPKQNMVVVYSALGTLGWLDVTWGYHTHEVGEEVSVLVDHTEEGHGENYGGERWVRSNPIQPVRFAGGSLWTAQKSLANKTSLPQGETS